MSPNLDDRCGPALPGAVGLTHLKVYDTAAPDGLVGGSAHVHFACTECYYVERGAGRVQTLCAGGFQEFALSPGVVVWFSPGVIHRLVNEGGLEIFVVMQNSGLPEAGDFVLTLPTAVLDDPEAYFAAASLSAAGEVFTDSVQAAHHRRDLAVTGFGELRREFDSAGEAALERFYRRALRLIAPKLDAWEEVRRRGALAAANRTGDDLKALRAGDVGRLMLGAPASMPAPSADRRLGMCGTLGVYWPEGASAAAITQTKTRQS